MRSSILVSAVVMAALSLSSRAARAEHGEEGGYPVSYVERPMTLPRMTLAPQLEIDINRLPGINVTASGVSPGVVAGMQIGATFGILDNLEVGAIVLPIQFNAGAGYGGNFVGEEGLVGGANPSIFGTFRFLHVGGVELGARLAVIVATPHTLASAGPFSVTTSAGAIIEPSVPLLLHIGTRMRLDASVGVPIRAGGATIDPNSSASAGLEVPVKLAFDIIEPLHVGLSTGVVIDDFAHAGDTFAIPLGIFGGYAIGEKRPIVDLDAFFNWFAFATPAVQGSIDTPSPDKVNPGYFTVGIAARGYLYFGNK